MTATLQVLYPATEGTTFDHDYYQNTHFGIVQSHMGDGLVAMIASKGLAGGPDVPPGFHAIATMTYENMDAMQAALGKAEPVLGDIPNYTNCTPQMLIGQTYG